MGKEYARLLSLFHILVSNIFKREGIKLHIEISIYVVWDFLQKIKRIIDGCVLTIDVSNVINRLLGNAA